MDPKKIEVIGGVLVFIGAYLMVQVCLFGMYLLDLAWFGTPYTAISWILNAFIAVLAFVGAILGILSRRTGGILAVLAGLTAIVLPLLAILLNNPDVATALTQFSSLWGYSSGISGFNLVVFETTVGSTAIYITIESVLILAGGTLFLIGEAKE